MSKYNGIYEIVKPKTDNAEEIRQFMLRQNARNEQVREQVRREEADARK